jgi:hypothetical protein
MARSSRYWWSWYVRLGLALLAIPIANALSHGAILAAVVERDQLPGALKKAWGVLATIWPGVAVIVIGLLRVRASERLDGATRRAA